MKRLKLQHRPAAKLLKLPDDVLVIILGCLPVSDWHGVRVSCARLEQLHRLPRALTRVEFRGPLVPPWSSILPRGSHIVELAHSHPAKLDVSPEVKAALPRLSVLKLEFSPAKLKAQSAFLLGLEAFPRLSRIELTVDTRELNGQVHTDSDVTESLWTSLAKCARLRSLCLTTSPWAITSAAASGLRLLRQLRTLDLVDFCASDLDWVTLSHLVGLQTLRLRLLSALPSNVSMGYAVGALRELLKLVCLEELHLLVCEWRRTKYQGGPSSEQVADAWEGAVPPSLSRLVLSRATRSQAHTFAVPIQQALERAGNRWNFSQLCDSADWWTLCGDRLSNSL